MYSCDAKELASSRLADLLQLPARSSVPKLCSPNLSYADWVALALSSGKRAAPVHAGLSHAGSLLSISWVLYILMAARGSNEDGRLRVRRCTNTKQGLSPCHKQPKARECRFAGVGTGEE